MPLSKKIIKKYLKNDMPVYIFPVIGSTNNEAIHKALRDEGGFALYAADLQTSGKGRRGHGFYSPPGGLYMTLSCPVTESVGSLQRLTCAAAVAVCEALEALAGLNPTVKWVNDIYLDGKKAAGILCELATGIDNKPIAVIIGVGVNLTTKAFPEEIAEKAVSVGDIDPSLLCAGITDRLVELYGRIDDDSYMEKYRELNFVIGRRISYSAPDGVHTAEAVGIADDGALIVYEDGLEKRLSSGEISIVPSDD